MVMFFVKWAFVLRMSENWDFLIYELGMVFLEIWGFVVYCDFCFKKLGFIFLECMDLVSVRGGLCDFNCELFFFFSFLRN